MKAQVLLPKVFNFPFTYNCSSENKIGDLVEVPFGSKKEIGVVWKNIYPVPQNIKIKDVRKKTEYSIDAKICLLYTSPSPRDEKVSRMPSSA